MELKERTKLLNSLFDRFESIIVLDTETTGIDCASNEIIELAALRAVRQGDSYRVDGELDVLIRLSERRALPDVVTKLTGITEQMLAKDGVDKKEACGKFLNLLDKPRTLLAAYNAQFDLCFLYYFLLLFNKTDSLKGVKMLDAMTVYKDRRDYPHKLSDAISAYSLQTRNTHRAIDDARATMELILAMERERDDLEEYINLFGYNPKYGISGPRISSVTYIAQGYSETQRLYEKKP